MTRFSELSSLFEQEQLMLLPLLSPVRREPTPYIVRSPLCVYFAFSANINQCSTDYNLKLSFFIGREPC
ncbi:hypothetical protein RND71_005686 [Anisodus tanguticus]|uniref:Uncharacterized protein n=1 Tax=Anisodus tanguticus TaxID=243964 RepID=A0AAE1VV74_9SOLA|nr:hypothetical protein RND71_005686 [Anisodus tanguticus]